MSLVAARAHNNWAGYLCLLYTASRLKRTHELRPDFKQFFDTFLRAADAPEKKPYVVPFRGNAGGKSLLFNANVAGSYAPSSIRPVSPLRQIFDIDNAGGKATFTFRPSHESDAKFLLLEGREVPAYSLACFLYRDFGFQAVGRPTADAMIEALTEDFGFALAGDGPVTDSPLFHDDRSTYGEADFEEAADAATTS